MTSAVLNLFEGEIVWPTKEKTCTHQCGVFATHNLMFESNSESKWKLGNLKIEFKLARMKL